MATQVRNTNAKRGFAFLGAILASTLMSSTLICSGFASDLQKQAKDLGLAHYPKTKKK